MRRTKNEAFGAGGGGLPLLTMVFLAGCGGGGAGELPSKPPPKPPRALAPPAPSVIPGSLKGQGAEEPESVASPSPAPRGPCPDDMIFVDTTYCPSVRLRCLKDEYNDSNNITICHEFAPGQACLGAPRRQRFCIDRFEYPNQEGAHPPVMVDWYDAAGACASRGKRLCWESEWVSACEGPEKLPFPYGLKRDPEMCNIDNRWLGVDLEKLYSKSAAIQGAELLRLDQSVASGARKGCVSGFGVRDLTGNVDEWVNAEKTYKKSKWAGLKGGAWGHVRNACRPMTTSHAPDFTYYFVSFRCCADAAPDAEAARDLRLWVPPPAPSHPDPTGSISPGWTPRDRGPNQPR
ncbi:MAG TPA: SUMF1/EgtB/PvdO family nonheme iron enzyme [Polyangiaceae bacterium]|nr:SUMF1/EgtB/PvdO family nonheme iron enzyme [Polyangiaceae bacterium]